MCADRCVRIGDTPKMSDKRRWQTPPQTPTQPPAHLDTRPADSTATPTTPYDRRASTSPTDASTSAAQRLRPVYARSRSCATNSPPQDRQLPLLPRRPVYPPALAGTATRTRARPHARTCADQLLFKREQTASAVGPRPPRPPPHASRLHTSCDAAATTKHALVIDHAPV
jgi:hypothetical protein